MRPPRSNPRRLTEALALARAEAEPATLLAAAQTSWPAAAGDRISAESGPVRERDGVVTIACRSAAWAQELDLLQTELLERLDAAVGGGRVRALRFRVGDPLDDTL